MRPSQSLELYRNQIGFIVAKNNAKNPRVFGSVLTGTDTEHSDLDLLVDPTETTTLLDIAKIQNQLQKLLKVSVDVLTPKALPSSFRQKILKESKKV